MGYRAQGVDRASSDRMGWGGSRLTAQALQRCFRVDSGLLDVCLVNEVLYESFLKRFVTPTQILVASDSQIAQRAGTKYLPSSSAETRCKSIFFPA